MRQPMITTVSLFYKGVETMVHIPKKNILMANALDEVKPITFVIAKGEKTNDCVEVDVMQNRWEKDYNSYTLWGKVENRLMKICYLKDNDFQTLVDALGEDTEKWIGNVLNVTKKKSGEFWNVILTVKEIQMVHK